MNASRVHACALRSDGVIECWGYNEYGQAVPTKQASTGSFTAVGTGQFHTCGVRTDGAVECWGWNDHQQALATPVVAATGKFTTVVGGFGDTCALRTDGAVECWGGFITEKTKTATTGKFTALDADGSHACGLRDDGAVECWGMTSHAAEKVAAVGKFTAVNTADDHTCALRADGAVECWGSNLRGQAPAVKEASVGKYTSVATGLNFSCGLRTDGVVECWGDVGGVTPTRSAGSVTTRVYPTATFTPPTSVIVGQAIVLGLTNAQVPGHPEAIAFTYGFNCGDGVGYRSATTTATISCGSGGVGTRTVKGKVIDKDGDFTEYTKTVTVLSATDAITALRATIATATGVSGTLRNPLAAKLDAAQAAIKKGQFAVACSALGDFESQVTEKRGKGIPVATANAWLAAAGQIKTAIGC